VSYRTPQALRTALEARIRNESATSGISPDRQRRRVVFQRIVTRLQRAEPGRWVLKGGMAMEVRLHDAARLTKDLDLGLRETDVDPTDLRDRLIDALARDDDSDGFVFAVGVPSQMTEDGGGHLTWRVAVEVELAGRRFGAIKLDVSPRAHELDATDTVTLPNALDFAGFGSVDIEILDVHRHAAEKLHGMLKDFGERENSRVRDLADLMLMLDAALLSATRLAAVVKEVWAERDAAVPPAAFPDLPTSWRDRYERLAAENDIDPPSFTAAADRAAALWREMFPPEAA
jgi:Nucleotidyl transferase AbiEii toxin, Type IV TA system